MKYYVETRSQTANSRASQKRHSNALCYISPIISPSLQNELKRPTKCGCTDIGSKTYSKASTSDKQSRRKIGILPGRVHWGSDQLCCIVCRVVVLVRSGMQSASWSGHMCIYLGEMSLFLTPVLFYAYCIQHTNCRPNIIEKKHQQYSRLSKDWRLYDSAKPNTRFLKLRSNRICIP